MRPFLKCSTGLGSRDSKMKVPWPSCPNCPRPKVNSPSSERQKAPDQEGERRRASAMFPAHSSTCQRHRVSAAARHLRHRLLDALHQLRDAVARQLLRGQAQFSALALAEGVESATSCRHGPEHAVSQETIEKKPKTLPRRRAHPSPRQNGSTHRTPS